VEKKLKGKEGKVKTVYRKKYCIYIERLTREKANSQTVDIPIHPSNVEITKLFIDKDRKKLLARKARAKKGGGDKTEKIQESEVKKEEEKKPESKMDQTE